mmetsp:Transcript_37199/g.96076  ORF Transcript_37199/g.96076 Transcript_37199/m.96076 type:complete len:335 (-) Transcript_37199:95-1099(-)
MTEFSKHMQAASIARLSPFSTTSMSVCAAAVRTYWLVSSMHWLAALIAFSSPFCATLPRASMPAFRTSSSRCARVVSTLATVSSSPLKHSTASVATALARTSGRVSDRHATNSEMAPLSPRGATAGIALNAARLTTTLSSLSASLTAPMMRLAAACVRPWMFAIESSTATLTPRLGCPRRLSTAATARSSPRSSTRVITFEAALFTSGSGSSRRALTCKMDCSSPRSAAAAYSSTAARRALPMAGAGAERGTAAGFAACVLLAGSSVWPAPLSGPGATIGVKETVGGGISSGRGMMGFIGMLHTLARDGASVVVALILFSLGSNPMVESSHAPS